MFCTTHIASKKWDLTCDAAVPTREGLRPLYNPPHPSVWISCYLIPHLVISGH